MADNLIITSPSRRAVLTGAAAMAVPLVAVPAVAAFDGGALDALWARRLVLIREYRIAGRDYAEAAAKVPAWAAPGPLYIDFHGNPCGGNVGWPEVAIHPGRPSFDGAYRKLRVSPYDLRKEFEDSVRWVQQAATRHAARAHYRKRMRVLIARLREQREAFRAAGSPQADSRSEALCDQLFEIESSISALPPCVNVAAASLVIDIGYLTEKHETVADPGDELRATVRTLHGLRYTLTGPIREAVDILLDSPERPVGEWAFVS